MAKSHKRLDVLPNQLSLLDLLTQEVQERDSEPGEGSLNIHIRLKTALSFALKQASSKSRWEIAGEMSHLLGIEISKYMIDSWVAESKGHKIPGEYIPAFCTATGSIAPLQVISDPCKVFTVQGPDALRAEIQRDEEEIKLKRQEKKKKEVLLAALKQGKG